MLKNTKANQNSISKINNAIQAIKETVPQEIKRESQKRRKLLDNAFSTLNCHCSKLEIELPSRGTFYNPENDLIIAEYVENQLRQIKLT